MTEWIICDPRTGTEYVQAWVHDWWSAAEVDQELARVQCDIERRRLRRRIGWNGRFCWLTLALTGCLFLGTLTAAITLAALGNPLAQWVGLACAISPAGVLLPVGIAAYTEDQITHLACLDRQAACWEKRP